MSHSAPSGAGARFGGMISELSPKWQNRRERRLASREQRLEQLSQLCAQRNAVLDIASGRCPPTPVVLLRTPIAPAEEGGEYTAQWKIISIPHELDAIPKFRREPVEFSFVLKHLSDLHVSALHSRSDKFKVCHILSVMFYCVMFYCVYLVYDILVCRIL
eukprot:GHVR01017211.1.p1 GENE.GHVR01017211.1~~GHVR01017211.1.p1  ORF type:complete len:160 (-),score=11.94 GHVR01017211.1:111-590(-)